MDSRLSDAAWNGNVETLHKLLREDEGILHSAASTHGQTPLHISCLAGHHQFVLLLMNLMPGFARELNSDGFSPLHIASAKGHMEIVIALLQSDRDLCLFPGVDSKIPLHCAVIKGRLEVVRRMIFVNTDSIGYITARGETVLHLAVKSNQFSVFLFLVENLMLLRKEHVLNTKDDQGNTVLHLAVSRRLYQVIKFLLDEEIITKGILELSSQNKRSLTPLDVLTLSKRETGDKELEDLLRQAGAKETRNFLPAPANQIQQNSPNGPQTSWIRKLINCFIFPKLEDSPSDGLINFLLIIAILMVTTTYQAAQNPPGGVWQEDRKGELAAGQIPHEAGKAILATKNPTGFKIYLFFNTVGFYVSISLICVLTSKFPMRAELLIAMFALCFTYGASFSSIVPDTLPDHAIFHLYIVLGAVILPLIMVHWYRLNKKDE